MTPVDAGDDLVAATNVLITLLVTRLAYGSNDGMRDQQIEDAYQDWREAARRED